MGAYALILNKSRNDENMDVMCTDVMVKGRRFCQPYKDSKCMDLNGVKDLLIPCNVGHDKNLQG